ncbi:hypothetical protein [Corynebacterium sp. AOP34-BR1-29]|uniref:hypothetical protein n=1 Tax=Corynebacterium sp. AOP34-BR1-29 TaxID=3457688 RepID=UPI004033AA92
MTIRRTALATVAAGVLTLTACSNDDQDRLAPTETPATTDPSTEPKVHEQVPGDTITYTGTDEYPADVDITIDDISASDTCHHGENGHTEAPADEDITYIQVSGEVDVRKVSWSDSFSILDQEWIALDPDGYQLQIAPPFSCESSSEQNWDESTQVGNKARLSQEYAVKGAPDRWVLNPSRSDEVWGWEIPEADTQEESADGPAPTPAADVPEPAAAPAEEVTATCAMDPVYQPGTTFYSDGTSGYTAACQQQMEDAMEASGNYPDYPFGNVDPNWTEEDAMRGRSYDDMSNAERSNHGMSAATPNDCDGYLGAHEDPDDSHC